ncbi:cytochrome oxidase [Photobacterium aquimaris]|uniref:Cytochrome oxidase n=1 Tax=Photobacterium aquimaris TaxID=512643 RepID=A0A2T3IJS5_9GAMM|nr:cytochrome oxidase [Photobacterium aquimaris]OBU13687.1 cytochrome oxidase [Photobacterium aquimaris]PSU28576.1 cytochrome oxidase [Photobacterium aquimaris]
MKKYQVLLVVAVVFIVPIIAAKLMLHQQWYQGGVTNRGQLLQPAVTIAEFALPQTWQLIYRLPARCDAHCQGALFNLRQVPQAAGADSNRLQSVVLVSSDNSAATSLLQGVELRQIDTSLQQQLALLEYGLATIYIADPHGNMLMAYPLVTGDQQILRQGKDVLRDLKRLLKVSKIG